MNHFYVHIPFCHRVCPYCKFAVSPVVNELTKKRYLEYLKRELTNFFKDENSEMGVRWVAPSLAVMKTDESKSEASTEGAPLREALEVPLGYGLPLETFGTFGYKSTEIGVGKYKNTLYFGGGTPSILSIAELKEIVDCFLEAPGERGFSEFTLESNPEDITEEKVKGWINLGVNRISIGVQSLNDKTLGAIHRKNVETIFRALEIIQSGILNLESGISINIDFILGLPYSKSGETLAAIERLHEKFPNITHTSVYILEDERYPEEWKGQYPTIEEVQTEYAQICEHLESKGWHHYEISNWAKPGYESTHNQSYWNHSNYRGFGLSAGSYKSSFGKELSQSDGGFSGTRRQNSSSFPGYFAGKQEQEILTEEQLRIENIMFGLRTFSLDESLIANHRKLEQFIQDGFLCREEKKILPTKTGIFMLDYIMSELV